MKFKMTDTTERKSSRNLPFTFRIANKFWSVSYLVSSAIILLWIVSASLTSHQFQSRISMLTKAGNHHSIWSVSRISQALISERMKAESKLKEIIQNDERRTELENDLGRANLERDELGIDYDAALGQLLPKLNLPSEERATVLGNDSYKEDLNALAKKIDEIGTPENNLKAEFKTLNKLRDNRKEFERLSLEVQRLEKEIRKTSLSSSRLGRAKTDVFEAHGIEPKDLQQVKDLVDQFTIIIQTFGTLSLFAEFPTELLTIVIVLSMGALGSIIQLAQLLIAESPRNIPTYLVFRPIFGSLVALAVFVLVKAGVLIAASATFNAQTSGSLNVFVVAFMGLIAGMLSDQAIDLVRKSGLHWLNSDAIRGDRWATGIEELIENEGRDIDRLQQYVSVERDLLSNWIAGREPTPPSAQLTIAAWLNRPIRSIFSDLPPE